MIPRSRLRVGFLGLAILIALGTMGYVALEGADFFSALYMVLITVSTVGFSEVVPLDTAGRVLTIVIVVMGVGLGLFTAGAAIEQLFVFGAARRVRRVQRRVNVTEDHVILCGFGRVGRGTFDALHRQGTEVVVIETDPERAALARAQGVLVIEGDATHDDALRQAGIDRARALVACVTGDADNLVIVLSARSLAPDLHVVSRASEQEWETKLRLAGADRVVAPQVVGSERLAAMAMSRRIADVFDVVVGGRSIEFTVEELVVGERSPLVGRTIRQSGIREQSGALILAVEDAAQGALMAPSPDRTLEAGMVVVLVGTEHQIAEAAARLG